MILVEKHVIKKNHPFFDELKTVTFASKNLYNCALYDIRQQYFVSKQYLNYYDINRLYIDSHKSQYYDLPPKVANQTLRLLDKNWKSFFSLLKLKNSGKYLKPVKIPKYLDKDSCFVATYESQAISRKHLKLGFVSLSKLNFKLPTLQTKVKQVRIVPKNGYFVIEVLYEKEESVSKEDNSRYAAIDIGVNNLATISSNVAKPLILNGRPLKSINQFANKRIAQLQSRLTGGRKTSRRMESIRRIRLNKVQDYLHKASREVANYVVSNNINCLVIGKNKAWKQNVNLGKKNNQNFVDIPFARFIEMINYKLKLLGVDCVINEESYTSKCSFLDFEEIRKHKVYLGKRIKRGLFRASSGKLINADLNGSLNILRKVVGNGAFAQYPIEVISSPAVLTVKFN